jgi:hypothetical protein
MRPNLVHQAVPADLDVHLVLDKSSTHKTPAIHTWLLRYPRFHLHFHNHIELVAQPGRALVRRARPTNVAPLRAQDRQCPRG